jgi:predicted lipid-binding transport protein (Tim44 family)
VQYFDIILFAVIAGVLAIRLYKILGIKSKVIIEKKEEPLQNITSIKKENNTNVEPLNSEDGIGLTFLKKAQPDFKEAEFLAGAGKALEMIMQAKYEANKKLLIAFLEDDIFRIFEKQILDQDSKGHSIENCNIQVLDSQIQEAKVQDNIAYIRVNFSYNEKFIIKNSDGSIFLDMTKEEGERTVTWVFLRPLSSDSPNWKLFGVNQIN